MYHSACGISSGPQCYRTKSTWSDTERDKLAPFSDASSSTELLSHCISPEKSGGNSSLLFPTLVDRQSRRHPCETAAAKNNINHNPPGHYHHQKIVHYQTRIVPCQNPSNGNHCHGYLGFPLSQNLNPLCH
jgi:hypothetical protein